MSTRNEAEAATLCPAEARDLDAAINPTQRTNLQPPHTPAPHTSGAVPTEAKGWIPILYSWLANLGFCFGSANRPKITTLGLPYTAAGLANSMEMISTQEMAIEAHPSTFATIVAAAGQPGAPGIISFYPNSGQLASKQGPPHTLHISTGPQPDLPDTFQVTVLVRSTTMPGDWQTIQLLTLTSPQTCLRMPPL